MQRKSLKKLMMGKTFSFIKSVSVTPLRSTYKVNKFIMINMYMR
jgi:hypothetical protein